MKTWRLLVLSAGMALTGSISFAQTAENPYAIFGGKPYIIGNDKAAASDKVFVIDNFAANSPIGRLEHDPKTGLVRIFGKDNTLLGTVQLKEGDKAWMTPDPLAEKHPSVSPYVYANNNPVLYIDPNGMDWTKNNETNEYQWMDDVNSRKNTPDGYSYVGATDRSIMNDMGLSDLYSSKSGWSPYLSLGSEIPDSPNTRVGAIIEAALMALDGMIGMKAEGYMRFGVSTGFDKDKITDNNSQGKVFNGLNVTAIMNQFDGPSAAKSGNLTLELQDGTRYSGSMVPQNGPAYIQMPGTYSMGLNGFMPASTLTSPIVGATLVGGSSNNSIIMGGSVTVPFNFRRK